MQYRVNEGECNTVWIWETPVIHCCEICICYYMGSERNVKCLDKYPQVFKVKTYSSFKSINKELVSLMEKKINPTLYRAPSSKEDTEHLQTGASLNAVHS